MYTISFITLSLGQSSLSSSILEQFYVKPSNLYRGREPFLFRMLNSLDKKKIFNRIINKNVVAQRRICLNCVCSHAIVLLACISADYKNC